MPATTGTPRRGEEGAEAFNRRKGGGLESLSASYFARAHLSKVCLAVYAADRRRGANGDLSPPPNTKNAFPHTLEKRA